MKNKAIKLTNELRKCVSTLAKEVVALNKAERGRTLNHNMVSGAIYHRLNRPDYVDFGYDEAVAVMVVWTNKENLQGLLAEFEVELQQREQQAARQVYGIVKNAIPLDEPDRDQKIEDVLRIVERYHNEVRSISGIRALVEKCKAKGYRDLDDDDIANLAAEQEAHAAECLSEN